MTETTNAPSPTNVADVEEALRDVVAVGALVTVEHHRAQRPLAKGIAHRP